MKRNYLSYTPILASYLTLIIFSGYLAPDFLDIPAFGVGQVRYFQWTYSITAFGILFFIILTYKKLKNNVDYFFNKVKESILENRIYIILISFASSVLFFLLRSNLLNKDGKKLTRKFLHDIPLYGAHITHDEIYELYIHSRFWYYTNKYFNWSVIFSYQVLSSIAGGIFIYLLILFAKKIAPLKSIAFILIMISGGYMQLFFGDAENYTLTAVLILAYFFASFEYLQKRQPLVLPSSLLALAMMFHLLAGFLLPSLLYLYIFEISEKKYSSIFISFISSSTIIIGTLTYFHYHGLPITKLFSESHALGSGGSVIDMLANPSWEYYIGIITLLFILCPVIFSYISAKSLQNIEWDSTNKHLATASFFMLFYMFIWRAQLGIYEDWNLFATVAIPVSIFIARNAVNTKLINKRADIFASILILLFIQTYTRIIYNHFLQIT